MQGDSDNIRVSLNQKIEISFIFSNVYDIFFWISSRIPAQYFRNFYYDIALRERKEKQLGCELEDDEFHNTITQDQLDFILRRALRISPQQSFQNGKA
jgi:hypothetical protein